MTITVQDITDSEISVLEENNFDWKPDTLYCRDIILEGTKSYINKVLDALGRANV